jgi:hypothetical protein
LRDLKRLLETYYPHVADFDGALKEQVLSVGACVCDSRPRSLLIENLMMTWSRSEQGAHLVQFKSGEFKGVKLTTALTMPLWVSPKSISLMTDKKAKR